MRRIGRKIGSTSIILIMLLSVFSTISMVTVFAPVVSANSGDIPTNGTWWNVTQNTVIEDSTFWVKNITVRTGFTLVIRNSTIEIKSETGDPSMFQVNHTGDIKIFNSTIQNYDNAPWKGAFLGKFIYGGGDGYRAVLVQLDNSTLKGFAGHHLDEANGLLIRAPLSGSYIHNCLFNGFVSLSYPDISLYNGTNGHIDIDGMTFWGYQYDLMVSMTDATQPPLNIKNLILTRGYVIGADYPVSVMQVGASGAGAIVNFTNPRGLYYTGVSSLYPNHTIDLYTPIMFNIRYGGGVPYNILRTADIYAYDDDFQPLDNARIVISNLDGEYYNETIDGHSSVDVLVAKNLTVAGYTPLWKYPITFRIYNDTYDYTRVIERDEWENQTLFSNDNLFVCSNNLIIAKNKFPDNHNFGWTFYCDVDLADTYPLTPVVQYMSDVDMSASWTWWAVDPDPYEFTQRPGGPGLVNNSYVRDWVNWTISLGNTVGLHTPSAGNDTREVYIQAIEDWYALMGWYPRTNFDHSSNLDNWQLVGSKGADPALPRTYYNIDYAARTFDYDRFGALCAGYQPFTYKYPHNVVGGLGYYALSTAPNSTEMDRGSIRNWGAGYLPMFAFNETLNNISDRLIWYRFRASGMDAPWQYTWEQYNTLDDDRGFFVGSGHWGSVAQGATGGNGWSKQTSGLPANRTLNQADPNFSPWDPDGTYVINDTATSGISAKSLFDGLSVMDGSFVPVEDMMDYLILLDGEDWLEDILHDNALDDEIKMMGGIEIFNQGDRIIVENRNSEMVESLGLILNQNLTLVNGTTHYFANDQFEVNLGDLAGRSRHEYIISRTRLNITTDCHVGYFAQNSTGIYVNLTNRKNGTVTIQMPTDWMYSTSLITIYDVTDDEIISWAEGSIQFNGIGGHDYRIYLGEDVSDPPRSPGVGGDWNGIIAMVISIMAVGLIVVVLKNGLVAPISRIGRRLRS